MLLVCNSTGHAFHLTSYSWVCMSFLKNYSNMYKMLCHLSLLGIKSDPLFVCVWGGWFTQRCSVFSPNSAQGSILAEPRDYMKCQQSKWHQPLARQDSSTLFYLLIPSTILVDNFPNLSCIVVSLYCCIIVSLPIKHFLFICSCTLLK